ncbi:MAG TPA: N-6 DNA methylase, partial [Longimicrobium sp.]|nr:N-6 DNA methylase [Longimicrobium sp.]
MSLDFAAQHLGWPSRDEILTPSGAGPRVFAELAREKLGKALRLRPDVPSVDVGVLVLDSAADATDAPIAIVCEFHTAVSLETLEETHRLAWNFCRAPLLVTLEPHVIQAWSCCEPPSDLGLLQDNTAKVDELQVSTLEISSLSQQAAESLHWVELASGEFFRKHHERFRRERCADGMLLANLVYVRERLKKLGLPYEVSHDLLARLIFIQFLFQRKDSAGNPALNQRVLRRLYDEGRMQRIHSTFAGVLQDYTDAYALFRWLNDRFNGDLFPGKGATEAERETEWQAEMAQVNPDHLRLLAQFVSGEIEMRVGQHCLWPQYSFDAIPLEFISSIYEVFVHKGAGRRRKDGATKPTSTKGVHYTPGHLVDFMLDGVLPWDEPEWDIRVLDPACGSGIFLVKAFQRLVYRWRRTHLGEEPSADVLRRLLERNIVGVDIDADAVRVASFSLYLAMCDEIDPRHYWTVVKFPRLRGTKIKRADFFSEDVSGINTKEDAGQYDIIVGNAPWGTGSVTEPARLWAQTHGWRTAYKDLGPLFLPKAIALLKAQGRVSMLQPAGGLLFNRVGTARQFRAKLFSEFNVTEVVNLSALRFGLFQKAISPACIATVRAGEPCNDPITYICPKSLQTHEDDFRVVIEPMDIHSISRREAASDPLIWTVFTWGGRRDHALIQRLRKLPSVDQLAKQGVLQKRQGIIRGDRSVEAEITNRRFLAAGFPAGTTLYVHADRLPINEDGQIHSKDSTNFDAFRLPQMIVKQAWGVAGQRFRAALVRDEEGRGILCSESYISVHASNGNAGTLESACLTLNSCFAVYYLLLTSGRFASYRPEPNTEDLLAVPIPPSAEGQSHEPHSVEDLDERVRAAFGFHEIEWSLIKDLYDFTLPDFKGDLSSPGRLRTRRVGEANGTDSELLSYGRQFLRVLKAGFGSDKRIRVTVFDDGTAPLPVRLVAVHLDGPEDGVTVEPMTSSNLHRRLRLLNDRLLAM